MMVFPDDDETRYAVFNKDRNRLLTDARGNSTYHSEEKAEEILQDEWGGASHLCVVAVSGV